MANILENHNNLNFEQKYCLGYIVSIMKTKESEIFKFENSNYKDYDALTCRLHGLNEILKREYAKANNELNIPKDNIFTFNNGIYTGLINPNRLSYTEYYK